MIDLACIRVPAPEGGRRGRGEGGGERGEGGEGKEREEVVSIIKFTNTLGNFRCVMLTVEACAQMSCK